MTHAKVPVLVYLDDAGNGLSLLREFGCRSIPISGCWDNKRNPAVKSKFGEKCICPSPSNRNAFKDFLVSRSIQSRTKTFFVPTTDELVKIFVDHYEELAQHYYVSFTNPQQIEALLDKHVLTRLCATYDISYPKTVFLNAADCNAENINTLSLPVLVKPLFHDRSEVFCGRKLLVVATKDELIQHVKHLEAQEINVIVQEIIPDCRYFGFYAFFNNEQLPSKYLLYEKIIQYPDQFGTGVLCRSIENEKAVSFVENLLEKMPFYGIAEIELLQRSDNGELYLIEINPRSIVQNSFSGKTGMNVVLEAYDTITGQDGHVHSEERQSIGEKSIWIDEGGFFYHSLTKGNMLKNLTLLWELRGYSWIFKYGDAEDKSPLMQLMKNIGNNFFSSRLGKKDSSLEQVQG